MAPHSWKEDNIVSGARDSFHAVTDNNLEDNQPIIKDGQCNEHVPDEMVANINNKICSSAPNLMQISMLGFGRRLLYGMAAPPSAMCTNILGFLMSYFLLEVANLTPAFVLTLSFAGRFWDAVSDPIVGFLVSRTQTKFGQCRIWILVSAPFCCATFFLFFHTPDFQSVYARFGYYFAVYMAFCTFMTTYHIPYTAMTMLISTRTVDRDAATTFRMVFEMMGTLIGVMTFTFITQHGPDRCSLPGNASLVIAVATPEEKWRYRLGAGVIGSCVLVCGCIGFFGTREVPVSTKSDSGDSSETSSSLESSMSADETPASDRRVVAMTTTFRRCLQHRPYRLLMLSFMLSSLAIQTVQNTLALYTIHSLSIKPHLKYAIAVVMMTSILCVPLVFVAIGRWGKKRVFAFGLVLVLPVCSVATLYPAGKKSTVPVFYACMVTAGVFVSIGMLLPWIMLPDAIDDYAVLTGRRGDSAAFYSLYVFFNKFAVGISTAVQQMALHFAGYLQPPACAQPASVGLVLRLVIGPLPILIVLAALAVLIRYPITPEVRRDLDEKLNSAQVGASRERIIDNAVC